MNKISKLTDDELITILNNSNTIHQVIEKCGYNPNGSGGYSIFKNECLRRNIDPKNHIGLNAIKTKRHSKNRISDEKVFVENSTYARHHIKHRIISQNLIPYQCHLCGLKPEWNGKKLSLQLEHMNGINTDHRIENLCFLCPNCHSQTETYGGKHRKK